MSRDTPPTPVSSGGGGRPSWKARFSSRAKSGGSENRSSHSDEASTLTASEASMDTSNKNAASTITPTKQRKLSKRFRQLLPMSPSNHNHHNHNKEDEKKHQSPADHNMQDIDIEETASALELLKWKDAANQSKFLGEVQRKQLLKERDGFCRRVDRYDGQVISVDHKPTYELGNYLGGGVAGVVYEGHRLRPIQEYPVRNGFYDSKPMQEREVSQVSKSSATFTELAMEVAIETTATSSSRGGDQVVFMMDGVDAPSRSRHAARAASQQQQQQLGLLDETVAIKILNPVGFRMLPSDSVERAVVVREGQAMSTDVLEGKRPMTDQHVWWLVNPNSRNLRTLQRFSSSHQNSMPVDGSSKPSKRKGHVDRGSPDKGLRLSLVAAYVDPRTNSLRELPLTKCIEIWGHVPFSASDEEFEQMMEAIERVNAGHAPDVPPSIPSFVSNNNSHSPPPSRVATDNSSGSNFSVEDVSNSLKPVALAPKRTGLYRAAAASRSTMYCAELNAYIAVPAVPPKYLRWLRQRRAATKEIRNMMLIGRHKNVVHLYEVLELIQDSKSTMFLILELVRGGELFDLISSSSNAVTTTKPSPSIAIPSGWDESEFMMRKFFYELAAGIYYCHSNGIAHRDLKPENLLVHNGPNDECTLKIADFGLSATFLNHASNHLLSDQDTDVGTSVISSPTQSPSRAQSFAGFGGGNETVTTGSPFPQTQAQQKHAASSSSSPLENGITSIAASALSFLTCGAVEDVLNKNFCGNTLESAQDGDDQPPSPLRRMTSVVGSPHYVAPEIISQSSHSRDADEQGSMSTGGGGGGGGGYDGTKADVWSAGVILYAMLFRSLPFGEDLMRCPRYQSFRKWYMEARTAGNGGGRRSSAAAALLPLSEKDCEECLGPHWFFPTQTSPESRDLIVAMLNPDPQERLGIQQVLQHPWITKDHQPQPASAQWNGY